MKPDAGSSAGPSAVDTRRPSDPLVPSAGSGPVVGMKMLVVEDDNSYGLLLRYQLEKHGHLPTIIKTGEEALQRLRDLEPGAILLDVNLPGRKGPEILDELRVIAPELPVVMMTAAGTIEMAVECMKRGAYDFLIKPLEIDRLQAILRNASQNRELRNRVKALEGALVRRHAFDQIIAYAPNTRRLVEQAQRAAQSDMDILILGESGTGKEVMARAVHFNSARRKGPFVAINCGAIPEGLLESELFGHEKGAFTGAVARRVGCFEQAHGGTLFLDEIGEMRPDMQVRLLRALEQREIRRVGSDRTIQVDVRVVSATNQDLQARLKDSKFRTDLYYRLAILVLELPALRERVEDIGPLAQFFLEENFREGHTKVRVISNEALEILYTYSWPGNVRELRNAIERAVVFEDTNQLTTSSLPPEIIRQTKGVDAVPPPRVTETYTAAEFRSLISSFKETTGGTLSDAQANAGNANPVHTFSNAGLPPAKTPPGGGMPTSGLSATDRPLVPASLGSAASGLPALADGEGRILQPVPGVPAGTEAGGEILTMEQEEMRIILRALSITGGNISEAARRLGLHRSTLHRKMTRFGLATDEPGGEEADGEF